MRLSIFSSERTTPQSRGRNRRQFARRAAATIAWMAIVFFALQIAFFVVVDRWFPLLYDQEAEARFRELHALVRAEPDRPVLLVLGSSRTCMAFRPDAVPPLHSGSSGDAIVYNFSHLGGPCGWSCLQLQRLIAAGIKPRWVVVEMMTPTLSIDANGFVGTNGVVYEAPRMLRYITPRAFARDFLARRIVPWHRNRAPLLLAVAPGWVDEKTAKQLEVKLGPLGWDNRFFETVKVADDHSTQLEGGRNSYEPQLREFRIKERLTRPFDDVATLCRNEKIGLVFVQTPESTVYRSWYASGAEEEITRFCADFQQRTGVPVIDARGWLPDKSFYDGHHVLPVGCELFTRRLCDEVLRPLVTDSPANAAGQFHLMSRPASPQQDR